MTTSSTDPVRARPRQLQATTETIRDRIRSGQYSVGERLPAQRDLIEDLQVHKRIVCAAMTQLEKEGLLVRRRNSRPIVQAVPNEHRPIANSAIKSSGLVGLVIHHSRKNERDGVEEQRIFWGLSQELGKFGFHAVFLDLPEKSDLDDAAIDATHLWYAIDHGFDGIIFYSYSGDKNRDLIRDVARQIPLILIDRMPQGIDADFVGMENFQSVFDATRYLMSIGHKLVAYVTTAASVNTVQRRLAGYLAAVTDSSRASSLDRVILTPSAGTDWPIFDAVFLQPPHERPTAVVCVNDYEAVRVAERLSHLGLTVPGDVSLVGCDDIVQFLPNGVGLTTIAQPFVEIGKEAGRLFLRRKKDLNALPLFVELPSHFIIRDSVKEIKPK